MLRPPFVLSEAVLAHDVYVCLECPSGAPSPEKGEHGGLAMLSAIQTDPNVLFLTRRTEEPRP